MLTLVRQIRVRGEEVVDQRDRELETDALRVGGGKGQDLQLFGDGVGAEHAVLRLQSDGRLRIDCRGGYQVTVNDRDVGRAAVDAGEWVRIGSHRLTRIEAPPGFDAALEVRIDADASPSAQERLRGELALKLPRARRYSYALALLVALFALGLPLSGYYHDGVQGALEQYGGSTDRLWSSGPLADAHHLPEIAADCNVCHVEPFVRVANETCLECHGGTPAHFPPAHPVLEEFGGDCRACHEEHNEPANLIVRHDGLCTDCHADERRRLAETSPPVASLPVISAPGTLPPATAFTARDHPEFLVSLLRLSGNDREGGWRVVRERLGGAAAVEESHLKFPHDLHLDGDKVSLADAPAREDRALVCADCHRLEEEGEHFLPLTMEATCSGCHTLAFDDARPARQLPHGEPETLREYLEEFYIKQAALQRRAPPPDPARRVPEKPPERLCQGDPLDCGTAWAGQEMDRLFTKAGCVSCHDVYRGEEDWAVRPVRLARNWFGGARFDHAPHLNPGLRADGGEACVDCHEAPSSSESADVLMPGIETCVDCHGEGQADNVVLQCLDCHAFHRPGMGAMDGL
jgi:predicted CXXCH cytochrome family protein